MMHRTVSLKFIVHSCRALFLYIKKFWNLALKKVNIDHEHEFFEIDFLQLR